MNDPKLIRHPKAALECAALRIILDPDIFI